MTTNDLFGFSTTDANALVGQYHEKAMSTILTTTAEIDQWMSAPTEVALQLQRSLPDDMLMIIARGAKQDAGSL